MNNGIPKREIKDIQAGHDARSTVLEGVRKGYEVVSVTYGPSGENVLQGMPYGDPVLTRDGVTVAKRVILADRTENDAWAVMRQASEKTNTTAGDGTTATVVLGYNLLKAAHQRVVAGENPMQLKKQMIADSRKIIDYIKSCSIDVGKHLQEVTTVSSGDTNIGALVADMLKDVGVSGGITIREQSYPVVDVEKIEGYYFNKGFFALGQQAEWEKPNVLVSQRALTTAADMLPIIRLVNTMDEKKLIIVGEVRGDALQILLANSMATMDDQKRPVPFEGIIIPPPAYGEDASLYMQDIATYVGGKVYNEAEKEVTHAHFGTASRTQVSQERAILFGNPGNVTAIQTRTKEIKAAIDAASDSHSKDNLEERYSKLTGKIAIVNVGASTPTEMEELRFRVEDAIEAGKSAMADGIVPGGATMLLHAALVIDYDGSEELLATDLFRTALTQTFKKLYDNAGEPSDYRLKQVQTAKFGYGFNLREMTEEPIDLAKAGIWDATRAVVQTIENATSAAGALLTVGALVIPQDEA